MQFSKLSVHIILAVLLQLVYSCHRPGQYSEQLKEADSLMEIAPDSALLILKSICNDSLKSKREKAYLALLMSMALDKNGIDMRTFDVIQPAIDFYTSKDYRHKTESDNCLRTYFYQGRIYQNRDDNERAMKSFIKGREIMSTTKDTLTMARLLTAQGVIFYHEYKFKEYIENSLLSADMFMKKGQSLNAEKCYLKALSGTIILKDKVKSDSILLMHEQLNDKFEILRPTMKSREINYHVTFDEPEALKVYLDTLSRDFISKDAFLDLAYAYARIGDGRSAIEYFENADVDSISMRSLKYLSIKAMVLETIGDLTGALEVYKVYNANQEENNQKLMSDDLLFAEKKHEMEMTSLIALREKDKIISICSIIAIVLIMMCPFLYYKFRLSKAHRKMTELSAQKLMIEKEVLIKENETAKLRNEAAEFELKKRVMELKHQHLEAENMRFQISELEEEKDRLKTILHKNSLSEDMRNVVKERLMILNALLTRDILNSKGVVDKYDKWIKSIQDDREKFMQSNQLAFRVSHPAFIRHLEEHGLTNYEIGYVCLYALGMLGKEVGEFTNIKGHYNLSTAIRKKLGIEENATALRVYVKKMLSQE